jgi:ribosome-binding ATPase YchF (GTP1/OBG family)
MVASPNWCFDKIIEVGPCNASEFLKFSKEEKEAFLKDIGIEESGLSKMIRAGYEMLDMYTYFTAGVKEVRAWTFPKGAKAPQAAGVIHSDFERGFIKAEVYHCNDLFTLGSEAKVKEAGKFRMEGKEY